jgi:hypothetical protein
MAGAAGALVLKLDGPISASSAGALVAISDKLFAWEGIEIELETGTGDTDAISAVTDNETMVGLSSAAGFIRARSS